MKSKITILLITLTIFSCQKDDDVSINLITDPSFELDGAHLRDNDGDCYTLDYTCAWRGSDGGEIQSTTNNFHGNYVWKTSNGSVSQRVELSPNTDYTFSCWVRGEPQENHDFLIEIGSVYQSVPELTIFWKKISLSFTTGTDNLTRQIHLNGDRVFIDFIELR